MPPASFFGTIPVIQNNLELILPGLFPPFLLRGRVHVLRPYFRA